MFSILLVLCTLFFLSAQRVELREAETVSLPALTDSNSPAFWWNGSFRLLQSTAAPVISIGSSQFYLDTSHPVEMNSLADIPVWFESVWVDDDGTVFGWYHNERLVCDGAASVPRIGVAVSYDGGLSFVDSGIVLEASRYDCSAANGYFAGGHGDFTVLLDSERRYFYIYFGNYSGPDSTQGIAVARMAFEDRWSPVGRTFKYFRGSWNEPGLGGRVTPILPAIIAWNRENTDAFWGPSLHWNYHLGKYVMLLTRSCCEPGWPTEGTYIAFNSDIANPSGWSTPERILEWPDASWYPQVIGLDEGSSDREAGQRARLYISGTSYWEIVFDAAEPEPLSVTRRPQSSSRPSSRIAASR